MQADPEQILCNRLQPFSPLMHYSMPILSLPIHYPLILLFLRIHVISLLLLLAFSEKSLSWGHSIFDLNFCLPEISHNPG